MYKIIKNLFVTLSFCLTSLGIEASMQNRINSRERSKCANIENEIERIACNTELDKLEREYKQAQEKLKNVDGLGKDTSGGNAIGAGLGVATLTGLTYKIVGSLGLGGVFAGPCYSCTFGAAASVLAFLYQSNLNSSYDQKYENAKVQLDQIYKLGKENNNGDFQYQTLEAEIGAIQMIYEAAKEKSKSHGDLKKLFSLVQTAAVAEIAICSIPLSGCSGNVPPAAVALGLASLSKSAEGKAKNETDDRVAIARNALEVTKKLKDKFKQYYEATPDSSALVADSGVNQAEVVDSASNSNNAIKNDDKKTTPSTVVAINAIGSSIDKTTTTTEMIGAKECVERSGDIISCAEVGSKGTYAIASILPKSKYTSDIEEKTNLSGALDIINKGFAGDYSGLKKIGESAKMATAEEVYKSYVKALLKNSKKLDPKVVKQLESSLIEASDEELARYTAENGDPALLAAIANRKLFEGSPDISLDKMAVSDLNTSLEDSGVKLTEGSLGDKSGTTSNGQLLSEEELLDLDGVNQTNSNLQGISKYQAAINEYNKKSGQEIQFKDIHTSKDDSIFEIISNRYRSGHVIRRLASKKIQ